MEGVTMKSIKYDKEEFQDLVNSVTPLQAVEWLLMNGYPIQVRNLGKSTVDILWFQSPVTMITILEIAKHQRSLRWKSRQPMSLLLLQYVI